MDEPGNILGIRLYCSRMQISLDFVLLNAYIDSTNNWNKMRDFTVRSGKYAGTHIIYDSEDEASNHSIIFKKPWYNDNVEIGDWVVSDDGYVIQCLGIYKLVNKRHRSGQYTTAYRFPNGTFYVYKDKHGAQHIKNFYAVASASHKNSLGNTPRIGRYMTSKKKEFVTLVAGGMDIYTAYVKAYSVRTFSRNGILVQINKLMDDPVVRKELMDQLQPFAKQLEDTIKEKTGADSLTSFLIEQITSLVTDPKSQYPKEKRENIKLLINLVGQQLGIALTKGTKKEIQDAEYQEIPMPQLGSSS